MRFEGEEGRGAVDWTSERRVEAKSSGGVSFSCGSRCQLKLIKQTSSILHSPA